MASPATANDPRHYTARDGSIRPVGGTHARSEVCDTCDPTPKRPVNFAVGQRVVITRGSTRRQQIQGLVSKVGRRYVSVMWTSKRGRRHESHRLASEITRVAAVRA